MRLVTDPGRLPLRGNDVAVDFVNTVSDVRTGGREFLGTAGDLLVWARHAGVVDDAEFREIDTSIRENTARGRADYREALRLRSALTSVLTGSASRADVALVDRHRRRSALHHELVSRHARWSVRWAGRSDLKLVISRIADAFVELATSGRINRVRQCDGPRCGWVFVDTSRGGRRRWCSMQDCGNRDKVRRFRDRDA